MPTADHRQPPTAQWLTHRYLTDRLTAEEIGELCGWSSQYIRDRLRDHGIPLRPPGTHRRIRQTLDRDTLSSWLVHSRSSSFSPIDEARIASRSAIAGPTTSWPHS